MSKQPTPLWSYSRAQKAHKWANKAALQLWGCSSMVEFRQLPVPVEYFHLSDVVEGIAFTITIATTGSDIELVGYQTGEDELLFEAISFTQKDVVEVLPISLSSEIELIFENAMVGIMYSKNRVMYKMNPRFAELYGYPPNELINQSSRILYSDEEAFLQHREDSMPVLKQGGVFRVKRQMKRRNGEIFWTSVAGKLINSDDPDQGAIWIVDDIDERKQANDRLKALLHEQEVLLDHAMVGIVFLKDRKVTRCNKRFEEMFGYTFEELESKSLRPLHLTEQSWHDAGQKCYSSLENSLIYSGEMELRKKDGSVFWCEVVGQAINPDDLSQGSIWINLDIDERVTARKALNRLLDEQQLIFDHAMVGMVYVAENKLTRCNKRFEEMFGYALGELEGASTAKFFKDKDAWLEVGRGLDKSLRKHDTFVKEMLLLCKNGEEIWCDFRGKAYNSANPKEGMVWVFVDITERKRLDKEIRYLARHDSLTDLPNRVLLEERSQQALRHAKRIGNNVGLLFIDVDNFKIINDSYGHEQGDLVLHQIAKRLKKVTRETDTVARFGGDEFVVLLTNLDDEKDLIKSIKKIQAANSRPVKLKSRLFKVTMSIGASLYPSGASDFSELMVQADIAMYRSKREGRDCYHIFQENMVEQSPKATQK